MKLKEQDNKLVLQQPKKDKYKLPKTILLNKVIKVKEAKG